MSWGGSGEEEKMEEHVAPFSSSVTYLAYFWWIIFHIITVYRRHVPLYVISFSFWRTMGDRRAPDPSSPRRVRPGRWFSPSPLPVSIRRSSPGAWIEKTYRLVRSE